MSCNRLRIIFGWPLTKLCVIAQLNDYRVKSATCFCLDHYNSLLFRSISIDELTPSPPVQ